MLQNVGHYIYILSVTSVVTSFSVMMDKLNPLIYTDGSTDQGFRHFNPSIGSVVSSRSLDSLSVGEMNSLSFQTFKFIKEWENKSNILLVGGKNHVYMLDSTLRGNAPMIRYTKLLTWQPQNKKNCLMIPTYYRPHCQNFIRFIELMDNHELMVCGTNAFHPSCRYYSLDHFQSVSDGNDSPYIREEQCQGECMVSPDPTSSSVSLYLGNGNHHQVFTALINSEKRPIIMRTDGEILLSKASWLKDPTFIRLIEYGDKLYIFFRELANELESGSDEQVTYARVAQVCKDDRGGVNILRNHWSSFMKARLICHHSDGQNILFNNLTSVSDAIPMSRGTKRVLYATFTTPWDWKDVSMTAVCAYSISDIEHAFENSRFRGEYSVSIVPLQSEKFGEYTVMPDEPPVIKKTFAIDPVDDKFERSWRCDKVRKDTSLLFVENHQLLYDSIRPKFSAPIYIALNFRATEIFVDYDQANEKKIMLYVGSESGKVYRLRNMVKPDAWEMVLVESITVMDEGTCGEDCAVRSIQVSHARRSSVFVAFTGTVVQMPIARCKAYSQKSCCSIDPDCGWNGSECVERRPGRIPLYPISEDPVPEICRSHGNSKSGCDTEQSDPDCSDETTGLNMAPPPRIQTESLECDLEDILLSSMSKSLKKTFSSTVQLLRKEQILVMKKQLTDAVSSTISLMLRNHKQEYCLPLPAVNNLVHVYPLLLREMELWHSNALAHMSETGVPDKCWTTSCPTSAGFSLPLLPVLWDPFKELLINFSAVCKQVDNGHEAAWKIKKEQCLSVPGLMQCPDESHPGCKRTICTFDKYAVDPKAFFRHANDTRYHLNQEPFHPLWKAVNASIENKTIRGHLELVVSSVTPFQIDYSPTLEKVKIFFYYKHVKDCDSTDLDCAVRSCDKEIDSLINEWFLATRSKMKYKRLQNCERQSRRHHGKRGRRRQGKRRTQKRSPWNIIENPPERCKWLNVRIRQGMDVTDNVWQIIVSRSQKSGGVYEEAESSVRFSNKVHLLRFFESKCPTGSAKGRSTFTRTGQSGSHVYSLSPLVSEEKNFIILRNGKSISLQFWYSNDTR